MLESSWFPQGKQFHKELQQGKRVNRQLLILPILRVNTLEGFVQMNEAVVEKHKRGGGSVDMRVQGHEGFCT